MTAILSLSKTTKWIVDEGQASTATHDATTAQTSFYADLVFMATQVTSLQTRVQSFVSAQSNVTSSRPKSEAFTFATSFLFHCLSGKQVKRLSKLEAEK